MKKIILLFFALFIVLSLLPGMANAANICNESSNVPAEINGTAPFNKDNSGKVGIVPCGNKTIYTYRCTSPSTLPATYTFPANSQAEAQTQCIANHPSIATTVVAKLEGAGPVCPCGLSHVFVLIFNIYKFIVLYIATPLAGLLIVLGGVIWVVSAGNPGLLDMGKRMFKGAIWGLVLIFGSWIIVNVVLMAIGYTGGWSGITF